MCDFEDYEVISQYSRPEAIEDGVLAELWSYNGFPVVATNHLYNEVLRADLGAIWKEFLAWKRQVEPTLAEEDRLFKTGINGKTVWVIDDGESYTLMYPEDYTFSCPQLKREGIIKLLIEEMKHNIKHCGLFKRQEIAG